MENRREISQECVHNPCLRFDAVYFVFEEGVFSIVRVIVNL